MAGITRSRSALVLCMLWGIVPSLAQDYPDTLWVRVIYYDYIAERVNGENSNPEFNIGSASAGPHTGMVLPDSLVYDTANASFFRGQNWSFDSIAKPVLGPRPVLNCMIDRWYRSWEPVDELYIYEPNSGNRTDWECNNLVSVPYDAGYQTFDEEAFKNSVIFDSLPFTHVDGAPASVYEFKRLGDWSNPPGPYDNYWEIPEYAGFFPIDTKGFGVDPVAGDEKHNYSFTMEMHYKFMYQPGLTFNFFGDDDLWVFVNGELLIDLGGVHSSASGGFDLDTLGLVEGEVYELDLFYAERNMVNSRIQITTNLFTSVPSEVDITVLSDTIAAGQIGSAEGVVKDQDDSVLIAESQQIQWSFIEDSMKTGDEIFNEQGDSTWFTATIAHRYIYIVGIFTDPLNPSRSVSDTEAVWVKPGEPDHIVIEGNPDGLTVSPNSDNPIDSISIGADMTEYSQVYATVRDEFGNYIEQSKQTAWDSLAAPELVVSAEVGDNPSQGQGKITKTADNGRSYVTAASLQYAGDKFKDSVIVRVDPAQYDSLRILDANRNPIDSIYTTIEDTATLYVQARRTDTQNWQDIQADWQLSNLPSSVPPPVSSQTWDFAPSDTGLGTITVTKGVSHTQLTFSIPARVGTGEANMLSLYPATGMPGADNAPYPPSSQIIAVSADSTFPIVAKIFHHCEACGPKNYWLSNLENNQTDISWEAINPSTGLDDTIGSFDRSSGAINGYTRRVANDTILIVAAYEDRFSDSVMVRITPGKPTHLTIEGSPNEAQDSIDYMEFYGSDVVGTSDTVYAVLRDQWKNKVRDANATWLSEDSTVVSVPSSISNRGIITKEASSGDSLLVSAWELVNQDSLWDTVRVILRDFWYTELDIITPGGNSIDSLEMSTNDDTTLIVIGRRSDDPGVWDTVQARWENDSLLIIDPEAPLSAKQWLDFSPVKRGSGWIRVSLGNDDITIPDTVWATF
ncbi:MAG: fibro-slime domain-containing protein, partial [Chitinivibrionales bacterium]|nr:fibro-slime domain-containing protein [Chitinivibrionales bacterium]